MKTFFVLANLFFSGITFANPQCKNESVHSVHYSPGKNISKIVENLPAHQKYLEENMKKGLILEAGAFIENDKPNGHAMMILQLRAPALNTQLVRQDPLVKEGIFNYELRQWTRCKKN